MTTFTKKLHSLHNHFLLLTLLGVLILFFVGSSVGAAGLYDNSITAVVTPENPTPKSTVNIRLDSSLIDLTSATISWFVNGKKIQEGRDMRTFQFQLGEVGQTNVETFINTADYGTISKNFSFAPTMIQILYEANSYTPPFYKGKALIPPEGVVTLLAEPNFAIGTANSKNFVFTWKKDGMVDGSNSGLGKNTYVYNNGRLEEDAPLIEVTVTSTENSSRGYASFRAKSVQPKIIFYEDNPLLGVVLNQAIPENYYLASQEMSFIGYPYFFGGKNKESSNLEYSWAINGMNVLQTGNSKTTLTVRKPEGSGSSSITLSLQNNLRIFQTAKSSIMINYGN